MKYRTHRLVVNKVNIQEKLEAFINNLDGEVIAIIPSITQFFMMYGAKINYLIIVEKVK
ncbi:MAG: hypothetical protein MUE56_00835 [Ignavibacteria bacterium]|jgi:hypothetical protein|nr:hypothetical protein [Ignavibacteria bacterium]